MTQICPQHFKPLVEIFCPQQFILPTWMWPLSSQWLLVIYILSRMKKTMWSRKPTGRGLKFKNHVFASGNWFLFNKIFTWLPMRYWSINLKLKRSLVGIKFSQFKQFSQTHVNNSKILGILKTKNPNPTSRFEQIHKMNF